MMQSKKAPHFDLFDALSFDLKRRFKVLEQEVDHFKKNLKYRQSEPSSTSGLMQRLGDAADGLKLELTTEFATEIRSRALLASAIKDGQLKLRGRIQENRGRLSEDLRKCEALLLAWHCKMAAKWSMLVERLGDLHDRLEQYVQRSNPLNPEPIFRRRSEQGLSDKYLNEHVRWVFRDLTHFANKFLGARMDHGQVPTVFQTWGYQKSSVHHSFVTSNYHRAWVSSVEEGAKDAERSQAEGVSEYLLDKNLKEKFISLGLSYWMPERHVLQPIIAHELAHQLIRQLYGRGLNKAILSWDESGFALTLRRLFRRIEDWIAPRLKNQEVTEDTTDDLTIELFADLLSTVRYRHAFAYAWILEAVNDPKVADIFHDKNEILSNLEQFSAGKTLTTLDQWARLWDSEFAPKTERLQARLPNFAYRGAAIAEFLSKWGCETDELAKDLLQELRRFSETLLYIYSGTNKFLFEFEHTFNKELTKVVTREDSWYKEFIRKAMGQRKSQLTLLSATKKYWEGVEPDSSTINLNKSMLAVQSLDTSVVDQICDLFDQIEFPQLHRLMQGVKISFKKNKTPLFSNDMFWRVEVCTHVVPESDSSLQGVLNKTREARRRLYGLILEDYLLKTAATLKFVQNFFGSHLPETFRQDEDGRFPQGSAFDILNRTNTLNESEVSELVSAHHLAVFKDESNRLVSTLKLKVLNKPYIAALSTPDLCEGKTIDHLDLGYFWKLPNQPPWSGEKSSGHVYDMALINVLPEDLRTYEESECADQRGLVGVHSTKLLGRYDLLELERSSHEQSSLAKSLSAGNVRRKRLVSIEPAHNLTLNGRQVAAVVLVSLKWESSRAWAYTYVSNLLLDKNIKSCRMLLSDGWEDFVLLFELPSDQRSVGVATDNLEVKKTYDEVTLVVDELAKFKMLNSSETLFASRILDHAVNDWFYEKSKVSFQFKFVCRMRRKVHLAPDPQKLVDDLLGTDYKGRALVWSRAGVEDIEVVPTEPRFSSKIHGSILVDSHNKNDSLSFSRVETYVSWRREQQLLN
jgi:hypothetical protein